MSENEIRHGEIYQKLIEPIWLEVSIYDSPEDFLEQFSRISVPQQHLFAVHWCCSEIDNGGFHQFFSNSTGILAPETVKGFREIGFEETARIVEEAMSFFGESYPREREKRNEILEAIEGETREEFDPFYKLDTRFYISLESENLETYTYRFEKAADTYAKQFVKE